MSQFQYGFSMVCTALGLILGTAPQVGDAEKRIAAAIAVVIGIAMMVLS